MNDRNRPRYTWLGHATVRCDLPGGEVVLIDPFIAGNPSYPKSAGDPERVDLILVTHAHSDHMGDAARLAKQHGALVISNFEITTFLASQGAARTSGMNLGGTQRALGLEITMVRADHSSSYEHEGRAVYGGLACGYVVRWDDDFAFYHAGDTALFSDMAMIGDLYRPELAFLPIGDHYTMDPEQAARACRYLNCRWVIPIHWGTFPVLSGKPDALRRALTHHGCSTEVVALQPGESWAAVD
jgi:L-ascorbate metabolism protein UlaG (beta-lactamase superfamily)